MQIGAGTGKNNGIRGGHSQKGSVSPARLRAGLYRTGFYTVYFSWGGIMNVKAILSALLSTLIILMLLTACTPKSMINGRVVDAETENPIKGAAIAVRWYEDTPGSNTAMPRTIEVNQDFTDGDGNFKIPEHQDKNFVMGVYKEGYICWSSRSSFSNNVNMEAVTKSDTRAENGMVVRLERLKNGHSHDQHASYAVLVAEEVTTSKRSPFYEAIKPMFTRWRDNLREEFKQTFQQHNTPEPD